MKTRTLTAALLILGSSCLCFSQTPASKMKKGKNIDIHIASGADSVRTTYLSLGLLAVPRNLTGIGVNVVGTAVQQRMTGLQVSGLLNATGDNANGLQVAGIANVGGGNANGVQIGGLMNISGDEANGVQIGGLINVNNEKANGLVIGGLMNIAGDNANGMFVGGLANVTAHRANGLQVAGLMNVTGDRMLGVQLASLLNVSGENTRGLQLAGLANVSAYMHGVQIAAANACPTIVRGVQIGAFNFTKRLDGLQIGVMNDCDSIGCGLQVGVVNFSRNYKVRQCGLVNLRPETRFQLLLFGGNVGKANAGLRVLNRHTYTLVGLGTHYAGLDRKFSLGFTYRAGLHQPLSPSLRLSEDLGYVHIENFSAKNATLPARTYALQGRVNLEYALTKKLAVFAGGGYSLNRHYGKAGNAGHKPIAEWGVILF